MKRYPAPHAASAAGGGNCLETRPGRNPGSGPQLQLSEHWWRHADRPPQMHRLRQLRASVPDRNDVPDGYFRTWVERYT